MSPAPAKDLIAFLYEFSPWGRKLTTYLALRKIPYKACLQPVTIPRPDLTAIGVTYRRIPVLSIGKDIYCDTALEITKLDSPTGPYPPSQQHPDLKSNTPEGSALEIMLNIWTETIGWKYAAYSIPTTMDAVFENPQFLKDRTEMFGYEWSKSNQEKLRVQSDLVFRDQFEFLETTLLSDRRKWLVPDKSNADKGPGMADLQVGWLLDWMREVGGCWPQDMDEASGNYPRFWAWLNRFRDAVAAARKELNAGHIPSQEAIDHILDSNTGYAESDLTVRDNDPSGLKAGERVAGFPREYASTHKDVGKLVGLSGVETVIETEKGTRVHHPRWLFNVEKA